MYKELNFDKLLATISKLKDRISDRFPNSNLTHICQELLNTAHDAQGQIEELAKPNQWVRYGAVCIVVLFTFIIGYTFSIIEWEVKKPDLAQMIQITEAFINNILLVGAALFFLVTFEARLKRRKLLRALHRLRSMAHVIDMHQLTKDPSLGHPDTNRTKNSPERTMSDFELLRYLDYCSEMFSLIGKIAAMYSEKRPESEIVSAANEIEDLCTDLSQKVWQKMVFLDKN